MLIFIILQVSLFLPSFIADRAGYATVKRGRTIEKTAKEIANERKYEAASADPLEPNTIIVPKLAPLNNVISLGTQLGRLASRMVLKEWLTETFEMLEFLSRIIRVTTNPKSTDVRISKDAYPIKMPTDPICIRTKETTSIIFTEDPTAIILGIIFVLRDATTIELSSLFIACDPTRIIAKIIKVWSRVT